MTIYHPTAFWVAILLYVAALAIVLKWMEAR